jgi:hypothetical protein
MTWGVSAAVHAAFETALPAETEAVAYPPSVIEEAPTALSAPLPARVRSSSVSPEPFDAFLPRRRPAVPPPAVAPDDAGPVAASQIDASQIDASPVESGPAPHRPPQHQAPDLSVLDQVLRGLQRMA